MNYIYPLEHLVSPRTRVLVDVHNERGRQDAKWGEQNHPDGTRESPNSLANLAAARALCEYHTKRGRPTWLHILREEVYEAFAETDPVKLRAELIQVAAVAVAWVEAIDRRKATT